MTIINILNTLCPAQENYELSVNIDLNSYHQDVSIGFFCIVDLYWERD